MPAPPASEPEVPVASVVLVATPIGNLGDVSIRARRTLEEATHIYCEDTRRTRALLSALDIRAGGRLIALHEHNERERADEVIARVRAGEVVAVVSDAGTPALSDPGERLVARCVVEGVAVSIVPGANAATAALVLSGLSTQRFCVEGFVPRKEGERGRLFEEWVRERRTIVAYESPQRIVATLSALAELMPSRRCCIARELTKVHEELVRGRLDEVAGTFAARSEIRGEIVLVLEGAALESVDDDAIARALDEALDAGLSVRDAVDQVASDLVVARRRVYELALGRSGVRE